MNTLTSPDTYAGLQRMLAFYGFPSTPITETEYNQLVNAGVDPAMLHPLACDLNAGFPIHELIAEFYPEAMGPHQP